MLESISINVSPQQQPLASDARVTVTPGPNDALVLLASLDRMCDQRGSDSGTLQPFYDEAMPPAKILCATYARSIFMHTNSY
jgi:hypothetical protein